MLQGQKFTWVEYYNGQFENRHYLLMPNEVKEFHELLDKGLCIEYAFSRLTGKEFSGKLNIQLEVIYCLNKPVDIERVII